MKNKKISKKELIKNVLTLEIKLGRKPKKRDNSTLYANSRKVFGSWNNLMEAAGYEVRFYQKIDNIHIKDNFAYFLGLLVTDGHIYYNQDTKCYKVSIYTSYPEERDRIIRLIKDLFKYNAYFSSRMDGGFNKKPNYEIRVCSKKLADILIKDWQIPFGAKSSRVRIPPKITKSNPNMKKLFLKGVIDGDGSISKRGIKIASGSTAFLKDLKELLNGLGIGTGSIITERETTFTIRINRKQDLLKVQKIYSWGPSYPRKKESINKI